MVIRESKQYVVDGIGKVTKHTALDIEFAKKYNEPESLYEGFAVLGVKMQGQVVGVPVEFQIPDATSIEDAFGKFKDCAHKAFEAKMAQAKEQMEAEQSKIQVVKSMPKIIA